MSPGTKARTQRSIRAAVWAQIRAASEKTGVVAKTDGDVAKALGEGERLDAAYEMPFLAHAPMEPMNCTVHVRPDACEVWVGIQVLSRAQAIAAKVTGLPLEKVIVHNHLIGGGFGRRLEVDMVEKAVRIAKQVDGPVKVVWTREEDIQHDIYRPVYRDVLSASLANGRIVGWTHRITGSSIIARWLPPAFQKGIDIDAIDSAADIPYDIPNLHVEYMRDEPPAVPTGFWRGVGPNNNVFAIESFIDELAKKAGKDPVAFRRDMLGKNPRLLAAVDLAASKAGWGSALPARRGRGIAAQVAFGSFIATVVEVEVDDDGEVSLKRIVSAVDTGIVVNPDTVVAQLQGGLIFGLTAALYGEITIDKGRVQQSNFHDYRMLRIDQVPTIEVHLIPSGEAPGGIGETGTTAGPPALGNAIYAATGVRLRRLPIDRVALATGNPHERRPRSSRALASSLSWSRDRTHRARLVRHASRARWRSSRARPSRWMRTPVIRPAFPRTFTTTIRSREDATSPKQPIAKPATPPRTASHSQADLRSRLRSARCIRRTSRRIHKPASAPGATRIFSRPCTKASVATGSDCIRRFRTQPTPT